MSSSDPRNNFMETDVIFLEFEDDLDNITGESLSVGNNTGSSSQQPETSTPRRCTQSRLLELERHVAINGRIPMMISPGAEKPISLHAVPFSQAIDVCVRKTFSVCCLKFVEHQMLTTFKVFQVDCHRHFKKYSDPEEARANPPNYELVERKGESADRVELFREIHVRARTFMSQATEDAHVLGRRPGYSKGLGWDLSEGSQDDECEQFVDILFAVHKKRD
ncbi:CACTA en-spm transposon protein [Cucumis melo var. makuwa]|uniref:CACTA en-spm transposon protein n=1 Tax=Cucumis melo var. makuwa TaxID=1194695 RepID=A0A5A7V0E6_CUCMM|nr:CACTA en-spm transposon protein [Cucumis melo var. makuwa]TYK07599.1 CACTA en-spm transposon protein [Cucumis melo var. makuwa]